MMQKQNVERAKSALLGNSLNNESAYEESYKQSDHLLMVVAYNKWARILHQVFSFFFFYVPINSIFLC